MSFCHKLYFSNPNIFATFLYFKLYIILYQTVKFKISKEGLHYQVAMIKGLENFRFWQKHLFQAGEQGPVLMFNFSGGGGSGYVGLKGKLEARVLLIILIPHKQIIKYNRWQQRNGPIIDDVTSVKYNTLNRIFYCKISTKL